MTTKRTRRAQDVRVPDVTENASERRRVLNILAQRRYRRRKKERLEALEAQMKEHGSSSKAKSRVDDDASTTSTTILAPRPPENESESQDDEMTVETSSPGTTTQSTNPGPKYTGRLGELLLSESKDDYYYRLQDPILAGSLVNANLHGQQVSPDEYDTTAGNISPEDFLSDLGSDDISLSPDLSLLDLDYDFQQLTPPHSPAAAASTSTSLEDLGLLLGKRGYTLAAKLQDQQVSTFTFPDDRLLEVPSLTLLNAVLTVALRLNVADRLWDTRAMSPFYIGSGSSSRTAPTMHNMDGGLLPSASGGYNPSLHGMAELTRDLYGSELFPDHLSGIPAHLQPTSTQRLLPHHPLLDLLPWPSTRDKLIQVFNVPPYLRPPVARDPLGMVRLVYDMEDPGGEGLSLSGQDPFEPRVWVIGQVMFDRWWWAFEANVINECNRLRRERGKDVLSLKWENRTFKSVGT
ncbi:hypothetical protein Egran_03175 [Elaphomyces granulatus]|uniref:BZIP domain-containing protein n=1 Tax=Elaphomyces granulatus TaxID=519963 RepID=A0A232LY91_9EURO|nr:hypothetical protein Egran_03175 [Elaphomyces granulatus]